MSRDRGSADAIQPALSQGQAIEAESERSTAVLERALGRQRAAVLTVLAGITALAWIYVLAGAGLDSHEMDGMVMPVMRAAWSPSTFALMLAMWAVMMAAMMLPSAAPMLLLYAAVVRRRTDRANGMGLTGVFGAGYVTVWLGFSLAAVLVQFALDRLALLSPMMETTSVALAGLVLIGAGLYQWTPLKQACLRQCRSPLEFITTHWRDGRAGAFQMGVRHGAYCLGCCWMLMLLLFVGGLMNVVWIAGISLFVLVEKLAPAGDWVGRIAGIVMIGWGGLALAALV